MYFPQTKQPSMYLVPVMLLVQPFQDYRLTQCKLSHTGTVPQCTRHTVMMPEAPRSRVSCNIAITSASHEEAPASTLVCWAHLRCLEEIRKEVARREGGGGNNQNVWKKKNFRKEWRKKGNISKNRRRLKKGQKNERTSEKGIYKKGLDMEYEFYLKIGCTGVNCKLNTHLAIESQIERKTGKSLYLLCYLKFNYSLLLWFEQLCLYQRWLESMRMTHWCGIQTFINLSPTMCQVLSNVISVHKVPGGNNTSQYNGTSTSEEVSANFAWGNRGRLHQ